MIELHYPLCFGISVHSTCMQIMIIEIDNIELREKEKAKESALA